MNKGGVLFFLLIFCFGYTVSVCYAQSVEEVYGLRLQETSCFQQVSPYSRSIDSTQVTGEGSHPLRLQYNNVRPGMIGKNGMIMPEEAYSRDCCLLFSRTIPLPVNTRKKERCTVSLNCRTELDLVRFIVIARDKEENVLYMDSVIIPANEKWSDYSLSFCNPQARTVSVVIRKEGCDEANQMRSIYLGKIRIRLGNQYLNDLPIASLAEPSEVRLKSEVIVPLSLEDASSLDRIEDWKDKKIIAIGESIDGIQDLMEVQVQLMKHLITRENCRLILMDLPQNQCFRWNLYLQGKRPDSYGEKLRRELVKSVQSPSVFFEFLQWLRDYNAKSGDSVRIAGITGSGYSVDYDCLTDYLLNFSTSLEDSLYYIEALRSFKSSNLKEYLEESELSEVLSTKDFQYLQFLIEELTEVSGRPYVPYGYGLPRRTPDTSFDEVKRFAKAIDIYLSSEQKAVFIAPSVRINKHFPLHDMEVKEQRKEKPHDLGSHLYKRYGPQYHTVSIQIGERTCLRDSSWFGGYSYPVDWQPLFPFSFERAAMDSEVPYFYYSSAQLPDAIWGLNLFAREAMKCLNPFCNCNISVHFDALVFIREVKAVRNRSSRQKRFDRDIFEEMHAIHKLLKERNNNH